MDPAVAVAAHAVTAAALVAVAYAFVTAPGRPDAFWPFIPFNTRYVTGYNKVRDDLTAGPDAIPDGGEPE